MVELTNPKSLSASLSLRLNIRYTYNHSGERVIKSHGGSTGVFINANPQGILYQCITI